MAEIDSYQHECIGIVVCPSDYELVKGNDTYRNIPLYLLKQDALDATSWQAKQGDLLLGGGAGESAALRISIPETIYFFTQEPRNHFESTDACIKAYWNMNEAFAFCNGYAKLGWSPRDRIEVWLAEKLLAFALNQYPELFGKWKGDVPLKRDGSICRLPTAEEKQMW